MLRNIQVLRALAALGVAISHLANLDPGKLAFLSCGAIGVDVFFVISGFIMVHIASKRPIGPVEFMTSRIVRVAPLYWALTLGIFALAALVPELLGATQPDPARLAKSLLFIPFDKGNGLIQPLLFQGWTLNLEMVFYALFALSLLLRSLRLQVAVLSAVLLGLVAWGELAAPSNPIAEFYSRPLMLEFALGMGLGLVRPRLGATAILACWAVFAGVVALDHFAALSGDLWEYAYMAFAVAVVVTALASEERGRVVSSPFLLLLGAASYSLYLAHPFASVAVEKLAHKLDMTSGWLLFPTMAASTAAMVVAGLLVYRWVERPLDRLARRLLLQSGETRD